MSRAETRATARQCATEFLNFYGAHYRLLPDDRRRGYDILVKDDKGRYTIRVVVEGRRWPFNSQGKRINHNTAFQLNPRKSYEWVIWMLIEPNISCPNKSPHTTVYLVPRAEAFRITHEIIYDAAKNLKRRRVFFTDSQLAEFLDHPKYISLLEEPYFLHCIAVANKATEEYYKNEDALKIKDEDEGFHFFFDA